MPASLAKLREKLENSIFEAIGTETITITRISNTFDKWGDATSTLDSSSFISGVPYDLIGRETFEPFANLQSGEIAFVVPYNTSFDTNDVWSYDGVDYIIKETITYPYQGGVLAYGVKLAKNF